MNSKSEIMRNMIIKNISNSFDDFDFDAELFKTYTELIEEIKLAVIDMQLGDFETVCKIVEIMKNYGIDCSCKLNMVRI